MTTSTGRTDDAVDKLLNRVHNRLSDQEPARLLEQIVEMAALEERNEEASARLRTAFLLLVRNAPQVLDEESAFQFLSHNVLPEDYDDLRWESPEEMLQFCDRLYGFPFPSDEQTEQVRGHVRQLLRQALQQYEQEEDWESLFLLLQVAPTSPMMQDVELMRLRHLARGYELRRIRRNRRWLFIYLSIQILLVIIVFPFLFIYAENGAIQRQVEQIANVELGDDGYRLFSYVDGLYWSVITAGSIGYGDITPLTTTGRIIAGVLGTMGVVTVGVVAGLVLKWITPRTLD